MAFTYDPRLDTNRDIVRFLVQDTVKASARLDNGEIDWALSTEANVYMAAALCADTLAMRLRGVKSKSVGGLSISYGAEDYAKLAENLRMKGRSGYAVPTAGGIYVDDREALREDSSLIQPKVSDGVLGDPEVVDPESDTSS